MGKVNTIPQSRIYIQSKISHFTGCFVVVKAAMIKVPHKDKSLCPSVNNAALRVISKIGKATALWGVRR